MGCRPQKIVLTFSILLVSPSRELAPICPFHKLIVTVPKNEPIPGGYNTVVLAKKKKT